MEYKNTKRVAKCPTCGATCLEESYFGIRQEFTNVVSDGDLYDKIKKSERYICLDHIGNIKDEDGDMCIMCQNDTLKCELLLKREFIEELLIILASNGISSDRAREIGYLNSISTVIKSDGNWGL